MNRPQNAVLRVVDPGPLTLLEDLGRVTGAAIGLPRGGAVDRAGLRLANRLVGNPEHAAGLEVLWGGLVVEALADTVISVCGAPVSVTIDGRAERSHTAVPVRAGAVIALGRCVLGRCVVRGVRPLVAVAGGLAGESLLGSVSASPAAGLGRAPLVAGDLLMSAGLPTTPWITTDLGLTVGHDPHRPLRVIGGPRDDWLTDTARGLFATTGWRVGPQCDRVGIRLEGPPLAWSHPGRELPSEAVVPGAVQVPPEGRPLVFLADHPTTGGYPVVGVVHPDDLDALGQAGPGDEVRFRWWR
ncbi:biotin-dependent carboxyltransferase family protein [Aestuariimicrobium soli]|uniref:5-oxoprolinase subunit C family protein n=1 Tax=Aestuariimicrobium soli TaxID=2035834 RepID=UPI003EBE8A54